MTIVNFEFNPSTRTLKEDRKVYSGQVGDSLSTTICIRYTEEDFLDDRDPYIVFDVYDDDRNPLVYSKDSGCPFDGRTFRIPWDVTIRCKSARVQFQVFYLSAGVEFDPRNVAQLAQSGVEFTMSSKAGIAIRPSISPLGPGGRPIVPTGTDPTVAGYIQIWKDHGLVDPVETGYDAEEGKPYIQFRTYSGENDQKMYLPTGNTAGTIPLIKGTILPGESLIYSAQLGGFISGSSMLQKGTCTFSELLQKTGKAGDVWNVSTAGTYNGQTIAAGTDWIYSLASDGRTYHWEPLTAGEDLSAFQLIENMAESWNNVTAEQYPSAMLVKGRFEELESDVDELSGHLDEVDEGLADLTAELHTDYYTAAQVDDKLAVTMQFRSVPADANGYPDVPMAERNTYTIYLVPSRTSKAKNVKDEYIWEATSEEWELIGSTTMKLNIIQDATGITINDVVLQDATTTQDGLMPKEMVSDLDDAIDAINEHAETLDALSGRVDALEVASADHTTFEMAIGEWSPTRIYREDSTVIYGGTLYISISNLNVNNEPSEDSEYWTVVMGGGGGGSGTMASVSIVFGNEEDTSYTIAHKFNTYDFLYSLRTNDSTHRYVDATVYASDRNHATFQLTRPPGINGLVANIAKCSGRGPAEDMSKTIRFEEASTVWDIDNDWEYPVFIQTYTWDDEGQYYDEIKGDVTQPPETQFTPVSVEFMEPRNGIAIMVRSDMQIPFENTDQVIIPHGESNQLFAVQMYDATEGMITGDVAQRNGTITISFDRQRTGWVVLARPSLAVHFDNRISGRVTHNMGRFVAMQVYTDNLEGQAMLECHNIDENTCEVDFNGTFSGFLLII